VAKEAKVKAVMADEVAKDAKVKAITSPSTQAKVKAVMADKVAKEAKVKAVMADIVAKDAKVKAATSSSAVTLAATANPHTLTAVVKRAIKHEAVRPKPSMVLHSTSSHARATFAPAVVAPLATSIYTTPVYATTLVAPFAAPLVKPASKEVQESLSELGSSWMTYGLGYWSSFWFRVSWMWAGWWWMCFHYYLPTVMAFYWKYWASLWSTYYAPFLAPFVPPAAAAAAGSNSTAAPSSYSNQRAVALSSSWPGFPPAAAFNSPPGMAQPRAWPFAPRAFGMNAKLPMWGRVPQTPPSQPAGSALLAAHAPAGQVEAK